MMKCESRGGADGVVSGDVLRLCFGCQIVECARKEGLNIIQCASVENPHFWTEAR